MARKDFGPALARMGYAGMRINPKQYNRERAEFRSRWIGQQMRKSIEQYADRQIREAFSEYAFRLGR